MTLENKKLTGFIGKDNGDGTVSFYLTYSDGSEEFYCRTSSVVRRK